MLFKCEKCGRISHEDFIIHIKEYMGECFGFPAYETWCACPFCKSTDILEYEAHPCCDNCKHLYTEYGCDFCYIHDIPLENQEEECCDDYEQI